VTNAVTLTTESHGNPVADEGKNTFPGNAAKSVLEVMTAQRTVASWLWLYAPAEITKTGRRFAGREPAGAKRSAQ